MTCKCCNEESTYEEIVSRHGTMDEFIEKMDAALTEFLTVGEYDDGVCRYGKILYAAKMSVKR